MKKLVVDQSGATAIEYGLIISLIVIALIASLNSVATGTIAMWQNVEAKTKAASGA
ncbi:MAG: Flp family type IVb pilin [Porphyrobacter sp.]|nr:Flp family type IVb pilin [Porphyrobacter sp.]